MSTSNRMTDLNAFPEQVATITDQIEAAWTGDEEWRSQRFGAIAGNDKNRLIDELLNRVYRDTTAPGAPTIAPKEEIRSAAVSAKSALQTPSVRATICRFLTPLTGRSSKEIAVEVAKASIPLVVAGTLPVASSPLVWSLIGFAAARIGAGWLCGGEER